MEKIGLWADKLVTHFWFSCGKCDQNVDNLKVSEIYSSYLCVCYDHKVTKFYRRNGLDSFATSLVNMSGKLESVTTMRLTNKNHTGLILRKMEKISKLCKRLY